VQALSDSHELSCRKSGSASFARLQSGRGDFSFRRQIAQAYIPKDPGAAYSITDVNVDRAALRFQN
jgi:hypothetical protein